MQTTLQENRVGGVTNGVKPVYQHDASFQAQALKHLDVLYNFAMYLTRRPSDADDLVQETYLRAFRFSHRFQPGTYMRAWLYTIMRNTHYTIHRIRERESPVAKNGVPDHDIPMLQDAPVYDSGVMDAHTDLDRAMLRIPEDWRTTILLAEVEGMPLEDVARVMACPVGTIKSRIFRAKEKLRGLLGDYDRKQTYDHGREDHYAQHNGANGNTDGHGRDEPHHWDDLVIKVDKALYNELHKILTPKQINPGVNNHPS